MEKFSKKGFHWRRYHLYFAWAHDGQWYYREAGGPMMRERISVTTCERTDYFATSFIAGALQIVFCRDKAAPSKPGAVAELIRPRSEL